MNDNSHAVIRDYNAVAQASSLLDRSAGLEAFAHVEQDADDAGSHLFTTNEQAWLDRNCDLSGKSY